MEHAVGVKSKQKVSKMLETYHIVSVKVFTSVAILERAVLVAD
jgi:hypothetical protein